MVNFYSKGNQDQPSAEKKGKKVTSIVRPYSSNGFGQSKPIYEYKTTEEEEEEYSQEEDQSAFIISEGLKSARNPIT